MIERWSYDEPEASPCASLSASTHSEIASPHSRWMAAESGLTMRAPMRHASTYCVGSESGSMPYTWPSAMGSENEMARSIATKPTTVESALDSLPRTPSLTGNLRPEGKRATTHAHT